MRSLNGCSVVPWAIPPASGVEPAKRDSYDAAQERKFDWHVDWSGADTARSVLEVGVGWGSFVSRLARATPRPWLLA